MTLEPDPDNAGGGNSIHIPRQLTVGFFMRVAIFANGTIKDYFGIKPLLNEDDILIGVDGGTRHLRLLSIEPSIIIGDLDSASKDDINYINSKNIRLIKHNPDKDYSDLELAVNYAIEIGCGDVIIFGALGNRWDHSIGNLLLPLNYDSNKIRIRMWEAGEYFYFIRDNLTLDIPIGTNVSLFPLNNCKDITTTGLKYPLKNENLSIGTTRGLSNLATEINIQITLNGGTLLCIIGSED